MNLSAGYLAGFFDGEGSIVISKRSIGLKAGAKVPIYTLVVCVANTHLPILTAMRTMFEPGTKRVYPNHGVSKKPMVGQRRQCFVWHAASDIAERFLEHVRPHLVVKAEQADLALEFRDHIRRYKSAHRAFINSRDDWLGSDLYLKIHQERAEMYERMKALKRPDFSGFDGMVANSGKLPCPARKGAEGQSRAKQAASNAAGRV